VRIISNKFDDPLCDGEMDLWTYLHFAGAKIRFYTGTSFMHSKYISIDNEVAAVSSINFSKNSLIKNREAGIIMSNDNSGELIKYTQSIFEYDFKNGEEFQPSQQYSKADINLIKDKTPLPVNISQHWHFQCKTESPIPRPHAGNHKIGLFASPDHAFGEVIAAVNQTQKSFWISIYEISHPDLCLEIIRLHQRGVEVKIFASNDVFGEKEKEAAHVCYNHLKAAGVKVRLSAPHCLSFSHQKVFYFK
jgi:phosphatidylserine/phosphatidylglycerophosphate/cardiolipin synthase-like enzyme